jgi:hypothetical protein
MLFPNCINAFRLIGDLTIDKFCIQFVERIGGDEQISQERVDLLPLANRDQVAETFRAFGVDFDPKFPKQMMDELFPICTSQNHGESVLPWWEGRAAILPDYLSIGSTLGLFTFFKLEHF